MNVLFMLAFKLTVGPYKMLGKEGDNNVIY